MKTFKGFPPQFDYTRIPTPFFTELLPEINDLGELTLTIYCFWRLEQMEGDFRYLRLADILEDQKLLSGVKQDDIKISLDKAVDRGTFLKGEVELDSKIEIFYFVNSPRGKKAIEALNNGLWSPSTNAKSPISLDMNRTSVFRLYEENIGSLTPLIAEALKEAEETFPLDWIKEAVAKAIINNVRNWNYISAILERWQKEGKHEQTKENRRSTEKDRKKYTEW